MVLLKDIIKTERDIKVVEKLCGPNSKCPSLFYDSLRDRLEYVGFNLINNEIIYFKRAENYGDVLGFSIDDFRSAVKYVGGVNLVKDPLSKHVKRCDVIIYWGGALACLRWWRGDKEQKYKDIVAEEYAKRDDDFLKVHRMIKERTKQEIPNSDSYLLPEDKLEEIILDDRSCLSEDGIIITNTHYDFDRIKDIMKLQPEFYTLDDPGVGMKEYEKGITVWRNNS